MARKVPVARLALGMYVSELDRPWLDSPFLFQGFLIESPDQLAALRECCEYVFVDEQKSSPETVADEESEEGGERTEGDHPDQTIPGLAINPEHRAFRVAVRRLLDTRKRLHAQLTKLLEDARLGHSVDTREMRVRIKELVELVAVNRRAALWLANLKDRHPHTAEHCLNTAVLAVAFGTHLGLDKEILESIGLGAVLHDLGKMRTPVSILDKPGILTEDEFDIMKKHPVDGFQMLRKQGDVPDQALEIVHLHHERISGGGYPFGLKGDELPLHVRIVAIVDVYDDISSERVYREGIPAPNCLNMMFHWAPRDFGVDLMQEFIRCIGIYPVGSLVQLSTGALGVVMSSNPEARLKPVVMLVRDREGRRYRRRPLVNLAAPAMTEGGFSWKIERVVDSKDFDIDLNQIAELESRT